jgi:hypothetical protein
MGSAEGLEQRTELADLVSVLTDDRVAVDGSAGDV